MKVDTIRKQAMISVVIPLFNEEESIEILHKDIVAELGINKDYELIFVDDGSLDSSLQILKNLLQKNTRIRIFSFRRRHGKAEALTFGFSKAKGEYIVTIDADLQDKPSEIPKLIKKARQGWDVVCGFRKKRKDSVVKVISSRIFNLTTRWFWGLKLHDYNCGLKVYSQAAAHSLQLYGGLHRFVPVLAHQQGFRVTEVEVIHEKRKFGKSKYTAVKILTDLPDIFTMLFLSKYGSRPLHFFGAIGFIFFTIGSLILLYLAYIKITQGSIGPRPILFLGMILVLSGLQTFFTGFLADLFLSSSQKGNYGESLYGKTSLLKYASEKA